MTSFEKLFLEQYLGSFDDLANKILLDGKFEDRKIVDINYIIKLLRKQNVRDLEELNELIIYVSLEIWFRIFKDKDLKVIKDYI